MKKSEAKFFMLGLNHETAPLSIRSKVAIGLDTQVEFLQRLTAETGIHESVVLSTCNRTEFYCYGDGDIALTEFLTEFSGLDKRELESYIYVREGISVASHLSRVAGGLDSMVLGETQIFGQVKTAFKAAQRAGAVGSNLNKLFQHAFYIAKRIRSDTEIGSSTVSLASAVFGWSCRIFPSINEARVLFVGAGEMIRLCAEYFSEKSSAKLDFCNRSPGRAKDLAMAHSGDYFALNELPLILDLFDIVVACTASAIPILTKSHVETAVRARRHRPIVIFDLSVPPNVEQSVMELDDIFSVSIDDLGRSIKEGRGRREASILDAEAIIQSGVSQFSDWIDSKNVVSSIVSFRRYGDDIVAEEINRALLKLENNLEAQDVMISLANSIKNKFLDRPSRLINSSRGDVKSELSLSLRKLFDLD